LPATPWLTVGLTASYIMRKFYQRFLSVRDIPVPVIAAINGAAIGAGAAVVRAACANSHDGGLRAADIATNRAPSNHLSRHAYVHRSTS
jgi:hypothetical protein